MNSEVKLLDRSFIGFGVNPITHEEQTSSRAADAVLLVALLDNPLKACLASPDHESTTGGNVVN